MIPLNRRTFLRAGLSGTALLVAGKLQAGAAKSTARPGDPGRARNVIFLVSDGMSLGTLRMAELYRRRHEGRGTHWLGLYERDDLRRALMDTSSANSPVTDSAAASSAWGCGQKVSNGSINIDPSGQPRQPILRLASAAGKATGLVTTATITHATPAGFVAQVTARAEETEIASQYLEAGVDVLLGGGAPFFDPARRADGRDLFAEYTQSGYTLVRDKVSMLAAAGNRTRLLGVFADGHLPFSLDHRADKKLVDTVPTLAEMAQTALTRLAAHPGGFVLQIEGARIDHAAHANDIGGLIHDQLAFDDAVGIAMKFASGRDDTLVILTSDHGNANPGLNSGGNLDSRGESYGDTLTCFDRIAHFRQTNVWALEGLHAGSTAEQVRERVHAATALTLAPDEVAMLSSALRKEHREGYRVRNAPLITLGQILANYTSVGWTGTAHTADYTELAAFGPGSESIQGLVQNTALFSVMTRGLGLTVPAA